MKYIGIIAKCMIIICMFAGIMSVAAARSNEAAALEVIDPMNAVIATVLAILVGIVIGVKRRIQR